MKKLRCVILFLSVMVCAVFMAQTVSNVRFAQLGEDEDMAYCLLPAADDERGAIPVTGNRRYVFFSSEYARRYYTKADELLGREYMFTTERSVS